MTMALLASPVPWVCAAAVFFGAAASRATSPPRGRRRHSDGSARGTGDPASASTSRWVFACVYLSIAVSLGLAAVFLPGPRKILDARLLYVAAASAGIAFLALRFKKSFGIIFVLLVLVAVIAIGLFLQSVRSFTGQTEIARVRVISVENGRMKLAFYPGMRDPVLLDMEGEYFAPIVKVIIFDDLYVFLGSKTWYRFEGMTSFKIVKEGGQYRFQQGNTDFYFPQAPGISEALWSWFEKNEIRIPGVKTVQVEMDLKRADEGTTPIRGDAAEYGAREFNTYAIMIQNDGGVEIQPVSN